MPTSPCSQQKGNGRRGEWVSGAVMLKFVSAQLGMRRKSADSQRLRPAPPVAPAKRNFKTLSLDACVCVCVLVRCSNTRPGVLVMWYLTGTAEWMTDIRRILVLAVFVQLGTSGLSRRMGAILASTNSRMRLAKT